MRGSSADSLRCWLRTICQPRLVALQSAVWCLQDTRTWAAVAPIWTPNLFFEVDEIRGAYLLTDVKQPAKPKLDEVLRLIARLGGFFGRKGDGEPGAKAVWLGLKGVLVANRTLQKLRAGGHAGHGV